MRYTDSAIGLLTRQYRSVLRKCFLINMGLFALGLRTAKAEPVTMPTIDYLNTKVAEYMADHNTYDLSTTKGTNTNYVIIGGTRYWYTPDETTSEKNNVLNYLVSTMTTDGATSENYIFKKDNGDSTYTYYTFNTTNLPQSAWQPTDGTSSNYDYVTYNGSTPEYHIVTFKNNDKLAWIDNGSTAPSGYTWADNNVAGSDITISGNTITGAIRMKMPHNGETPSTWNRYFTYTYTVPAGYTLTQTRIDNTIAADGSNVQNKVFAKIKNNSSSNGGAIYNTADKSTVYIIADFIGNNVYDVSGLSAYGGAISNYAANSSATASIGSIVGDFIGNRATNGSGSGSGSGGSTYGGAIYSNGSNASIGNITGNFIGNESYTSRKESREALGGAIFNYSTIGNITGDFIGNRAAFVASSNYGGSANGGAISNVSAIGNIIGDFIGNEVYATNYASAAYGGAIQNSAATINTIVGDFIGNSAITPASSNTSVKKSQGGAIYNTGTIANGIINSTFLNNHAEGRVSNTKAQGGAIYTTKNMTLVADGNLAKNGGISTISGNYVSSAGTTKNYEAIYIDSNTATFAFNAINNGQFLINDYVNGASGYGLTFTGDNTGTVNYNNKIIGTPIVNINNVDFNWNMSGNNVIDTSALTSLTLDNTTVDNTLAIDFNATSKTADKITTTALSSGTLNLNTLNITGDFTTWDENTKVRIIQNSNGSSTLQLALDSSITTPDRNLGANSSTTTYDEVVANTSWTDTYQQHTITGGTKYGNLNLATTTTENDSIGITNIHIEGGTATDTDIDTLWAVNTLITGERSFNATSDGETYNATGNIGTSTAGTLNINGVAGGSAETVNLGNYTGLVLSNATTLNINDVRLTGTNGNVVSISNASAELNLDNADINGNMSVSQAATLNVKDSILKNISGNSSYKHTLNLTGNNNLNGTVTYSNININSGMTT
ncbi:MAG: hypothetical protein J6039_05650, partial [Alphaproteobacteria bacterium]|nr:hypothetical protein [Alphaproteobacteria bacterium]